MLVEYSGLLGMLAVGIAVALGLFGLAGRLRRRLELAPPAAWVPTQSRSAGSIDSASRTRENSVAQSNSRYFMIAIVALTLQAGAFYFYMWGAAVREVGLSGLMVMLGFDMCLIVGIFYSWARGAVAYAIESDDETRTNATEQGTSQAR